MEILYGNINANKQTSLTSGGVVVCKATYKKVHVLGQLGQTKTIIYIMINCDVFKN